MRDNIYLTSISRRQSVMMKTVHTLWFIYVILCARHIVHSATIKGKFGYIDAEQRDVYVSEYINVNSFSDNFGEELTLHTLVNQNSLQTLTLINLTFVIYLQIKNIFLETIPVFINVSGLTEIFIVGNKIKIVPTNAFNIRGLERIQLGNNQIDTISDRAFNNDLTILDLRCNKLRSFSHTWFQNPGLLEEVALSGNRIEYLQERAFERMTRLRNLVLTHNGISRIDSAAFRSNYMFFDLSFNNISVLSTNMFARGRTTFQSLYIAYNRLNFLSAKLLRKFKTEEMLIDGNPWQCPCLRNIERWMRENHVSRYSLEDISANEPVCAVALTFSDVCVSAVSSDLQQLYAKELSPLQGCLARPCGECFNVQINYKEME